MSLTSTDSVLPDQMDSATAELVAEIHYLLGIDVPDDVRAQAIFEAHRDISNEQYEQAWLHLDSATRRRWKEYAAQGRWAYELHGSEL